MQPRPGSDNLLLKVLGSCLSVTVRPQETGPGCLTTGTWIILHGEWGNPTYLQECGCWRQYKGTVQGQGQNLLEWRLLLPLLITILLSPFLSIKVFSFFFSDFFFLLYSNNWKVNVQIPTGFSSPISAVGHPGLISPFKESPAILLADILIRFSQESQRRGEMELQWKKSTFLYMPVNYNFTAASEKKNKRLMAEHFSCWEKKIPRSINSEGERGRQGQGTRVAQQDPILSLSSAMPKVFTRHLQDRVQMLPSLYRPSQRVNRRTPLSTQNRR